MNKRVAEIYMMHQASWWGKLWGQKSPQVLTKVQQVFSDRGITESLRRFFPGSYVEVVDFDLAQVGFDATLLVSLKEKVPDWAGMDWLPLSKTRPLEKAMVEVVTGLGASVGVVTDVEVAFDSYDSGSPYSTYEVKVHGYPLSVSP